MLKTLFNDIILKRMFKNASVLFGGKTIAGLMGLVSISLAARKLGPAGLGVFALIQSFIIIIDRLINFQSWQAIVKFGADSLKQGKKDELNSLAKFCTLLDAATAFIGTLISIIIVCIIGKWKGWQQETIYAAVVFSFYILFDLQGTPIGLLRLFNKFKFISAAAIAGAFTKLILAVFAYIFFGSLAAFAIVWVAAWLVESAFLFFAAWRQINKETGGKFLKIKSGDAAGNKKLWKFVLSTNLNLSVSLAAKEADILIVGAVLGATATGLYKIAKQFTAVLLNLIEPIQQAVYPELAHLAAEKRFPEMKRIVVRTAAITGGIVMAIWLAFIPAGRWILSIAAGKEYVQAWGVMIVFMFAFVICGFAFCLPAGLLAMGKAGENLLVQTTALAVFLPTLYLLLGGTGLIGAGIAQVVFFSVYGLLALFFFAKNISRESA